MILGLGIVIGNGCVTWWLYSHGLAVLVGGQGYATLGSMGGRAGVRGEASHRGRDAGGRAWPPQMFNWFVGSILKSV